MHVNDQGAAAPASQDLGGRFGAASTGVIGDRHGFSYRLQGTNGDGRFVIEQRAYAGLTEGKITWMRVLCSGFQPLPSHP